MPELEFHMLSLSDETEEWRYFSFVDEIFLEFNIFDCVILRDKTKWVVSCWQIIVRMNWVHCVNPQLFSLHCSCVKHNPSFAGVKSWTWYWSSIRSLAVEMMMKTTFAAVVRWAWRQRRHSYSGFYFLARLQHSFTRIFSNYLFNNAGTHRAEDTDLFIYFVKKNHWNSRLRYTIRLYPSKRDGGVD